MMKRALRDDRIVIIIIIIIIIIIYFLVDKWIQIVVIYFIDIFLLLWLSSF